MSMVAPEVRLIVTISLLTLYLPELVSYSAKAFHTMTNLLKIGTFSLLSHLSVRTLHHYDEIGLLRPSYVDAFTGYRYYTPDQLPDVHHILALKDLGLSLEQIANVIHDAPTTEDLCAMLRLRRAQLASELQDRLAQLARVE